MFSQRIDMIIRWGGMRRLSGFLPIQSVYSDFYVKRTIGRITKRRTFWKLWNGISDRMLLWEDKKGVSLRLMTLGIPLLFSFCVSEQINPSR